MHLDPGHEGELESVPGPELPGQRLVGEQAKVLLQLVLAEAGVDVKCGDRSRPSLALN